MPPPPRLLTRRLAVGGGLGALAAAAVAGCSLGSGRSQRRVAPAPTRRAGTNPDVALAARVLADERAMLARVRATVRRHPRLSGPLAGAESAHRAHVRLLARAVPDEPSAAATPSSTPSSTPSTAPAHGPVPARPAPALAAVARAEQRLSLTGRRSSFDAQSGAFARVLASMAAAAAQQAAVIGAAARDHA